MTAAGLHFLISTESKWVTIQPLVRHCAPHEQTCAISLLRGSNLNYCLINEHLSFEIKNLFYK
ncbi:MAG: hypothetical protein BGP13_09140 [Sphingobacteriales bacterium 40-81]|nr:MAG: hypothetical protein BGP13_09140 [Sphingobacteriales bacterium 40-81]